MADTIFVQIASYRDPELRPTLQDLLAKAEYPENLTVCICWQHSAEDAFDHLDEYKEDPRFKILDFDCKDSKGTCWARNQIQQHYEGEEYTLQLDSHHRFVKNWDTILIDMLKELQDQGHRKPLITSYVAPYDPFTNVQEQYITDLAFDRFTPRGVVLLKPNIIPDESKSRPIRGRFYSGHFAFTLGEFAVEVQHNPEYYFHGEEISIAARAYTHGYDIFYPNKQIAWHMYTREGRSRHWDDHKEWYKLDDYSQNLNKKLFENNLDEYGFGTERTLQDYEMYAGVCFEKRGVTKAAMHNIEPPDTSYSSYAEFQSSISQVFKYCINLEKDKLPLDDYKFIVVAFHNEKEETLHRTDLTPERLKIFLQKGKYEIWVDFVTTEVPKYWVVWPYSESKEWCERLSGDV